MKESQQILDSYRVRRQSLAAAISQLMRDIESGPPLASHKQEMVHEKDALKEAFAALARPWLPSSRERCFQKALNALKVELEFVK